METNKGIRSLEDKRVNVKTKLALFWVALMFLYIYNDIFSLFQPGHVADLVDGNLEGVEFNQTLLFSAAILMSLPSFMILLTLVLKARVVRWINIVMGFFQILVLVGTQFVGDSESWYYWRFNELLELIFLLIIIRTAWKWPSGES